MEAELGGMALLGRIGHRVSRPSGVGGSRGEWNNGARNCDDSFVLLPVAETRAGRNSNVEALRIIAMLAIVLHHYSLYGVRIGSPGGDW